MNKAQNIALIAQQPQAVFHVSDLRQLWGVKNTNTLYTMLKRYVQQGLLYRIYKGFYALISPDQLDPWLLGVKAIHNYAYISTETVLTREGIIPQIVHDITLVSADSRSFEIASSSYLSRQLQDKYLYNPVGIFEKDGIFVATAERAVADLLYFNPRATFDGRALIDFDKVREIQVELGYDITPNS